MKAIMIGIALFVLPLFALYYAVVAASASRSRWRSSWWSPASCSPR